MLNPDRPQLRQVPPGSGAPAGQGRDGVSEEDTLPKTMEREVDRRALLPRLLVLGVLTAGALLEYGHGHRTGHWIVLAVYALTTIALAAASHFKLGRRWLPWAATTADASLAVYVIADHLPRDAHDVFLATDAVSLFPGFLLLLQTGLRLRRDLVALFAGIVVVGWLLSLVLYASSGTADKAIGQTPFTTRQTLGLMSFAAAAGFVFYAVHRMRLSWSATLRARAHRMMLSRFLPEGVAAEVIDGEGSEIEERHVCLLSIDIRGFSALTQMQPGREIIGLLLAFRRLAHDEISRHGGIVDKYIGDGVLAVFLDGPPEHQAVQALKSARAILDRVRAEGAEMRVTTTLNCGHVLAGVFDDGRRAEFTVLGPAMNALSRIERRSKEADLDLVVSKTFLRLLPLHATSDLDVSPIFRHLNDGGVPDIYAVQPIRQGKDGIT